MGNVIEAVLKAEPAESSLQISDGCWEAQFTCTAGRGVSHWLTGRHRQTGIQTPSLDPIPGTDNVSEDLLPLHPFFTADRAVSRNLGPHDKIYAPAPIISV